MKMGLVLEGGAKRGIYTAGVLDVFLENGITADCVIGVSAGAIHGCSYVSGQKERSIRYNIKYCNDKRFMSLYSLFTTGDLVGVKFCYHDLPEKLDPFDNEAFEASPMKFYVVCSNLETGKPEYIHCDNLRDKMDYLRASASLPFLSRIVETGGKKFLDGGITDSIPLRASINLGCRKNIVVLTRPEGYRKKPAHNGWLAGLVYHRYPKFAEAIRQRSSMYNQELDFVSEMEKTGTALVLRPSKTVRIGKMEQNPQIVREMYDLGRYDALNNLQRIKAYLND